MTDPAGTTTFTYDQHGRLLSKTQAANGITLTTSRTYDSAGRLASMTYPSGKIITFNYNANGQVNAILEGKRALISNIVYRPYGPAQSWSEGNGSSFTRTFDLDGHLTSIGMGTVSTMSLVYDAANRITSINESGQANQSIVYDSLDRLTGYLSGVTQTSYS